MCNSKATHFFQGFLVLDAASPTIQSCCTNISTYISACENNQFLQSRKKIIMKNLHRIPCGPAKFRRATYVNDCTASQIFPK